MSDPKNEDYILRYKDCRTDIDEEYLKQVFLTKKNGEWVNDASVMTGVSIKYDFQVVPGSWTAPTDLRDHYPTAMKITDHYGDKCPNAGYSILPPETIFDTHVDIEIRGKNFIRVHIPLIVPEGELFMIVGEDRTDWSDIFAFNGQVPHSAHNLSDKWRLIFLMDLEADAAGIYD